MRLFRFLLPVVFCFGAPIGLTQQDPSIETQFRVNKQNSYYALWLDQDVRWIITDQERSAFHSLKNDEERDRFIEAFWTRRNPTPDELKNAFEDEHYRRMVYANEHLGNADLAGWETDRGRIYIRYGAPDRIESFPAGKAASPPLGNEIYTAFPKEIWFYRYVDDVGSDVKLGFVDTCMCGDYRMTIAPDEKDAPLFIPRPDLGERTATSDGESIQLPLLPCLPRKFTLRTFKKLLYTIFISISCRSM